MKRIELSNGQIVRLMNGRKVHCTQGTVWITWENSGDIILRSGDSTFIPGRKNALGQSAGRTAEDISAVIMTGKDSEHVRYPDIVQPAEPDII